MGNVRFIRLAEVVNKKQDKRVVSVTVVPTVTDCSGRIWFTDLQLQEGPALTGYAPHTEVCLKESENAPVWFNGIVRSKETVILLNLGGISAGLDNRHDRFVLSAFVWRQVQILFGICIFLGLALAIAALSTWNVNDPSFSYATVEEPTNILGYTGAVIADLNGFS